MFKFQAIAEGSLLTSVGSYDCMSSKFETGSAHVAPKGYIVTLIGGLTLGVVFQTEECGKQWVAIDRMGTFWSSYGNTRNQAAQWLLKRARA